MKKVIFMILVLTTLGVSNTRVKAIPPPPTIVIRAYVISIRGANAATSYDGFLCFYNHATGDKELAVFYYGRYPKNLSASWSFTGYDDPPPNHETIAVQDYDNFKHLMDKNNIEYPPGKGVSITPIQLNSVTALYSAWAGQTLR